jgi:hypothetical protein
MPMTTLHGAALGCAALLMTAASAWADCTMTPWTGSFEQNPTFTIKQTIRTGGCRVSYRGGLNTTYESLTILRRPRHLQVSPGSNGFSLNLSIVGGYKGRDAYTVRLCGRSANRRGCFTLAYDVTVQ